MNTTATSVLFDDLTAGESPTVIPVWSAGNSVLTCKPSPAFANNHHIQWNVDGQDALGNFLTGTTAGSFTTVLGVNGGSGTNAVTTFLVGRYDLYTQTSNAPSPLLTHEFFAQTTLASNRTATRITVTIPTTAGVSNLLEDLLAPEKYSKTVFNPNLTTFNATFPAGNYVFNVSAPDQQVTVNLPSYAQPNVPQVNNFSAAQAIDPSQPFTLSWNTFTNGGSADWILFEIDGAPGSGTTLFQTPNFGQPGALHGAATSFTVPAGVLQAGSTNNATLAFYHLTSTTNGGTVTLAFVASATLFKISTTAGSAGGPAPRLTLIRSGANVLVEWQTNATGYTLAFSTNLASSSWSTVLPSPVVVGTNKVVTNSISGPQRSFRLSRP